MNAIKSSLPALIFLIVNTVSAGTIELGLGSLPSNQGFSYLSNTAENQIWSTDGTTLSMDSIGPGGVSASAYQIDGIVNSTNEFTAIVDLRVNATTEQSNNKFGFGFSVHIDQYSYKFGFGETQIQIRQTRQSPTDGPFDSDIFINHVTTDQFHEYKVIAIPGQDMGFYIDGILVPFIIAPFISSGSTANRIEFGDLGNTPDAEVDIMRYHFSQAEATVPEPSTYALMLTGLLGFGFLKHKRRSG